MFRNVIVYIAISSCSFSPTAEALRDYAHTQQSDRIFLGESNTKAGGPKLKPLCRPACLVRISRGYVDHETPSVLTSDRFGFQSFIIQGIYLDCLAVIAFNEKNNYHS